jgi:hypothetical protein
MAYVLPTTVMSAATNTVVRSSLVVDPATTSNSPPTPTTVSINGFNGTPTGLSDLPQFNEWWQMIAYGAAIKILIEEGDWTEAAAIKAIFEEQKMLAQRKTLRQLAHQRTPTIYSQNSSNNAQWPIFPLYSPVLALNLVFMYIVQKTGGLLCEHVQDVKEMNLMQIFQIVIDIVGNAVVNLF